METYLKSSKHSAMFSRKALAKRFRKVEMYNKHLRCSSTHDPYINSPWIQITNYIINDIKLEHYKRDLNRFSKEGRPEYTFE